MEWTLDVNNAPKIIGDLQSFYATMTEDETNPTGWDINSILATGSGSITDGDANAVYGIAITGADDGGIGQVSISV